ncbi:MAG: DNA adenine methylase [Azoarcus sp.]|nr:DNA adenine methylase [Azoarcus sp.]
MPVTDTPLRYPGGKSQLAPLIIEILKRNDLIYGEYAEPFAGGSGLAMSLLLNDYVSKIYLNDIDPAIYAFWSAVLNHTDSLCDRIETVEVTMNEWHRQRQIFLDASPKSALEKGFATLFLNRTNRSGILRGGVIGGLAQNGNYKLDCRFNRVDLVRKIRRIASYRDYIEISCLDAATFLEVLIPNTSHSTLVNLDPPYFGKGPELYTNFYMADDHAKLAIMVANLDRPWIVTYDDTPEIRSLYSEYPMFSSSLNYFAQVKRIGVELLVSHPGLILPPHISNSPVADRTDCTDQVFT